MVQQVAHEDSVRRQPSDMDTPRLHRSLSALPYDAGVTCDIRKINVKYDR